MFSNRRGKKLALFLGSLIGLLTVLVLLVYVYEKNRAQGGEQAVAGSAKYFSNNPDPGSEYKSHTLEAGSTTFGIGTWVSMLSSYTLVGQVKPREPAKPMMGRLANDTLRAELGRAAWRLLHTMCGRFPLHPDVSQQQSLHDYIYLFAELYPCGECAEHFQAILKSYPPDVSSREAVAKWACFVHNKVNDRLEKPQHNCSNILFEYDCGCGED